MTLYTATIADKDTFVVQSKNARQVLRNASRCFRQEQPDEQIVVQVHQDENPPQLYASRKVRDRYWKYL